MSIHKAPVELYDQQLQDKVGRFKELMAPFSDREISVFSSPAKHYRMRAEFKMWHEKGKVHYAMYEQGQYKRPFIIDEYDIGSERMNELMPTLLSELNQNDELKHRLFQAEFLTTTTGEAVVTLIYHRQLNDDWQVQAETLSTKLKAHIIGRSRKQKRVIGADNVFETMTVGGRNYRYQQVESSFTQPNASICNTMLNWATESTQSIAGDLLELYCGNGNFTLPLSQNFDKVLATEISKTSVNSALLNIKDNQIDNIEIARMSSEEFSQAMDGEREFRRLKHIDLSSYNFSTVFVDPPRAGLDDHTVDIVKGFEHIIYVSCNPETLCNNLTSICDSHEIIELAMFDQFPYTHHIEAGVVLKCKS